MMICLVTAVWYDFRLLRISLSSCSVAKLAAPCSLGSRSGQPRTNVSLELLQLDLELRTYLVNHTMLPKHPTPQNDWARESCVAQATSGRFSCKASPCNVCNCAKLRHTSEKFILFGPSAWANKRNLDRPRTWHTATTGRPEVGSSFQAPCTGNCSTCVQTGCLIQQPHRTHGMTPGKAGKSADQRYNLRGWVSEAKTCDSEVPAAWNPDRRAIREVLHPICCCPRVVKQCLLCLFVVPVA
jgi:hypothetical protein